MNPNDTIELSPEERTPCEVWTRVMGYHRPVSAFNVGKRAEHIERCYFNERPQGQGASQRQTRRSPARHSAAA